MKDAITFVVLVTIDTYDKIGATSVYGISEVEKIIQEGAKVRNYKNVVVSWVDTDIKIHGVCPLTAVIS